ncbi:MAG: carbonic anhydrase [Candidatus Altiarchaeota archaeon]|nr:carbonic anhydrase [Candidatus Altiarchaeota archaeon]
MFQLKITTLESGWKKHLKHFRTVRRKLSGYQDPKIFCLSCSDSRVSVHEIFDLNAPGSIFEAKNIGGLFSDEARAALVYALNHLHPEYIMLLHHTHCGGYMSLETEVESEIRNHMHEYGGGKAKTKVTDYLISNKLNLQKEKTHQLIVEEGLRMQMQSVDDFLTVHYPQTQEKIKNGEVSLLPLIYDIVSGKVFRVPEKLEGSENMVREEF